MTHDELERAFIAHVAYHHDGIIYAKEEPAPAGDDALADPTAQALSDARREIASLKAKLAAAGHNAREWEQAACDYSEVAKERDQLRADLARVTAERDALRIDHDARVPACAYDMPRDRAAGVDNENYRLTAELAEANEDCAQKSAIIEKFVADEGEMQARTIKAETELAEAKARKFVVTLPWNPNDMIHGFTPRDVHQMCREAIVAAGGEAK